MCTTLDNLYIVPEQRHECENEIRLRAYFNWLDAGCPQGRDVEFWLDAEREWIAFNYVPNRSGTTDRTLLAPGH